MEIVWTLILLTLSRDEQLAKELTLKIVHKGKLSSTIEEQPSKVAKSTCKIFGQSTSTKFIQPLKQGLFVLSVLPKCVILGNLTEVKLTAFLNALNLGIKLTRPSLSI